MRVALIGEAPGDTEAIRNLLAQHYNRLDFVELLRRINGSMLDNKKAISRLLRVEYELYKPDIVIFIRDLDALEDNKDAKDKRQEIFSYSNSIVNKNGIFLLNIFELEALILSDIEIFNVEYDCDVNNVTDPMNIREPKEFLITATKRSKVQFLETHNPEIFRKLRFDVVRQNCRYFDAFIKKFDKTISAYSRS